MTPVRQACCELEPHEIRQRDQQAASQDQYVHIRYEIRNDKQAYTREQGNNGLLFFAIKKKAKADAAENRSPDK